MNARPAAPAPVVMRTGRGSPLLLIHGLGGPAIWQRIVPALEGNHDVLVPHLAGFGDSHAPPGRWRAEDHAASLRSILEELALTGVAVAGISYGGLVAAHLAAASKRAVTSVVLICPAGARTYSGIVRGILPAGIAGYFLRRLPGLPFLAELFSRRAFFDPASRPADLVPGFLAQLSLPGHAAALHSALHEVATLGCMLPDLLQTVPQPVRLVWGAADRIIPARHAATITDRMPDVPLEIVPECGHSLPLEKPEEICRILRAHPAGDRFPR